MQELHEARRSLLPEERTIHTFAFQLVVIGTAMLMVSVPVAGLLLFSDAPFYLGPAALVPGLTCFVVGRALQRFTPWSRQAALVVALPLAIAFPPGTWVACRVCKSLLSESGRTLFTPSHASLRALTPQVSVPVRWDVVIGLQGTLWLGAAATFALLLNH